MPTSAHYDEARYWLADVLRQTATWRQEKAHEYPDDPRNTRSASALYGAASHIQNAQDHLGVRRVAELVHDANASEIDIVGRRRDNPLPGPESERVAARYFFDHFGGTPDARSHDELVDELYFGMLRDLRSSELTPASPLARRIRQDEPPADEPKDPLTTLRRLLSEDLAQRELTAKVTHLAGISTLLADIADAAIAEADDEGRVGQPFRSTRLPLQRKRLHIATTALAALGGPDLEAARKLITEPPQFETATISAVLSALDEVNAELEMLRA